MGNNAPKTFEEWLSDWRKNCKNKNLRLGQHFCNQFIRISWPELYNETNDTIAKVLIIQWLKQHHHWPYVPHQ